MKMADRCRYGLVAVVTGASSGIGLAVARQLAARGFRVYGLSRRTLVPEIVTGPGSLRTLSCDVNNEKSVSDALAEVAETEGGFGILINCAGLGIAGAIEETPEEDARAQMETNFFGTLRMCRLAMPYLRRHGNGIIVNTGSVAGFVSIPFQGLYSASKAATDALSLAIDAETRRFGTRCVLVQPGDTNTGFTDARITARGAGRADSPYAGVFERSVAGMVKSERSGDSPDRVAAAYVWLL